MGTWLFNFTFRRMNSERNAWIWPRPRFPETTASLTGTRVTGGFRWASEILVEGANNVKAWEPSQHRVFPGSIWFCLFCFCQLPSADEQARADRLAFDLKLVPIIKKKEQQQRVLPSFELISDHSYAELDGKLHLISKFCPNAEPYELLMAWLFWHFLLRTRGQP